jgi:ferredoxin-thioredoxin reductase catalytic chain
MKKYWRCFVCNDIHYGLRPPQTCPTCQAVDAFVEISPQEAARLQALKVQDSERQGVLSREKFLEAIRTFAAKLEFDITSDQEKLNMLLDGVMLNEKEHGLKYCPCRLASGDLVEDLKLVCPCNFRVHETYRDVEKGECWCGLFVKR